MPVNWYENDVILAVEGATDEILTKLALQGEGLAKTNAPSAKPGFDTGFMRNAIYAIFPGADNRNQAESKARAVADRSFAPLPDIGEHTAAIHAAAEYTIYWEMRFNFLYNALKELQKLAPGVIQEVGRKRL